MRSFILVFDPDDHGDTKRIAFDALDPHYAFQLLERERIGRLAVIFEGEKRLGSLKRTRDGAWQIGN